MARWMVCASCGLKHTAREDGLCPRCRSAAAAPTAHATTTGPAEALLQAPPAQPREADARRATVRFAGKLFILFGALSIISTVLGGPASMGGALLAAKAFSILVEFAIGALLLAGVPWAPTAAKVRAALGLAAVVALWVFAPQLPMEIRRGLSFAGVLFVSLPFFLGMLVMLGGEAGVWRRGAGGFVVLVPWLLTKGIAGLERAASSGRSDGAQVVSDFLRGFFCLM